MNIKSWEEKTKEEFIKDITLMACGWDNKISKTKYVRKKGFKR